MVSINRNKGFTLVELLVVIAIIAILAGLLLPALENARNSAFSLQCLTRMRNWGSAFSYYGDDFDQVYPAPWASYFGSDEMSKSTGEDYRGWFKRKLVGAYIDTVAEQQSEHLEKLGTIGVGCPMVPLITEITPAYPGYGLYSSGSGSEQYYFDDNGCVFPNKVLSHSEKVLLAETGVPYFIVVSGAYMKGGYRFYKRADEYLVTLGYTTNFPNMPHNQGANYLFFDGHAAWYPGFPVHYVPSLMLKMLDAYGEHPELY